MGVKERQERDREAVHRSILDAARDLFVSEGYQNVSIRKIAERIEYSPAALYSYFPSKDDIFFALAEEGFRLLHDASTSGATRDGSPLDRIRQTFWRLYLFSRDHRQYFALMFVDRTVPRVSREYERFAFAKQLKQKLIAEVQLAIDQGLFPRGMAPAAALRMLTTAVVGVAVLTLSDRLGAGEDADDLARDALDVTIAGLQAGTTPHAQKGPCPIDLD